jgi:NAD(P)-dependent dehydrogenase (short-subunit alcohol dehydrogenase family)
MDSRVSHELIVSSVPTGIGIEMKNAILFGASSEIGVAIIQEYCDAADWTVTKVGSSSSNSGSDSGNLLLIDWNSAKSINDISSNEILQKKFELVVISLGYLSETDQQLNSDEILINVKANLVWPLLCLEFMESNSLINKSSIVIVVSSSLVALPPTRKSFLYTILKSTLENILTTGLRFEYVKSNIIFLRPGYVDTKINRHLPPGRMATTPNVVAQTLVLKLKNGKKRGIVYAPSRIGFLSGLVKFLPMSARRWALEKLQNS